MAKVQIFPRKDDTDETVEDFNAYWDERAYKEIAVMPPTGRRLLLGWLARAARLSATVAGLLFAAGWLLGGCK